MVKRKSQLIDECNKRAIFLDEAIKYTNRDLISLLGEYTMSSLLPNQISFGLKRRLELESLQLCTRYTDLPVEKQLNLFSDPSWIAEPKKNGARLILCYTPDEGFSCFSRNISDVSFLPLEYTEKVLYRKPDTKKSHLGHFFKNHFKYSFILDCEAIAQGNIDTTVYRKYGTVTESEQNATATILSLDTEVSQQIQTFQAPLSFYCFDLLYFNNEWVLEKPLKDRQTLFKAIVKKLSTFIPIEVLPQYLTKEQKEEAWAWQLENKGEGLVFKNLEKPYLAKDKRDPSTHVKLKRSMNTISVQDSGEDIDAFITGFTKGKKGTAFENMVGSVEFSTYLIDEEAPHVIANISGINLELRKALTVYDAAKNKVSLNPDFLGKVCVINGMSVSPKNLRFSHATSTFDFREDKSKFDCTMSRLFLESNII